MLKLIHFTLFHSLYLVIPSSFASVIFHHSLFYHFIFLPSFQFILHLISCVRFSRFFFFFPFFLVFLIPIYQILFWLLCFITLSVLRFHLLPIPVSLCTSFHLFLYCFFPFSQYLLPLPSSSLRLLFILSPPLLLLFLIPPISTFYPSSSYSLAFYSYSLFLPHLFLPLPLSFFHLLFSILLLSTLSSFNFLLSTFFLCLQLHLHHFPLSLSPSFPFFSPTFFFLFALLPLSSIHFFLFPFLTTLHHFPLSIYRVPLLLSNSFFSICSFSSFLSSLSSPSFFFPSDNSQYCS